MQTKPNIDTHGVHIYSYFLGFMCAKLIEISLF